MEVVVLIGLLLALLLVATIFGIELLLGRVFRARDFARGTSERIERPAVKDFRRYERGRHIYYQDFVGYLQYPYESSSLNINSHGFRSPEIPLRNLGGRRRLLMLGASALEGVPNCADDETISHHLQARLNKARLPVDVINAGVRSYSIKNELNLLYRLHQLLDFDAIIVFDGMADHMFASEGNLYNGYPRITRHVRGAWEARINGDAEYFLTQAKLLRGPRFERMLPNVARVGRRLGRPVRVASSLEDEVHAIELPIPHHYDAGRAVYLSYVRYMHLFSEAFNKPILFAAQPCLICSNKQLHANEHHFMSNYIQRRMFKNEVSRRYFGEKYRKTVSELERYCHDHAVPFLDAQPIVDRLSHQDVFYDNMHLNSIGNEAIAAAMRDVIEGWFSPTGLTNQPESHPAPAGE